MVINPIVGVYIPILRIPIKGGIISIPNIATFDHGTYAHMYVERSMCDTKSQLGPKIESHEFCSSEIDTIFGEPSLFSQQKTC